MKKLVALALALVMALSLVSAIAEDTVLTLLDMRPATYKLSVPAELSITTNPDGTWKESWNNEFAIYDCLIEIGKMFAVKPSVTTPLTNGRGMTLDTKVQFNHSTYGNDNLKDGWLLYKGNEARGLHQLVSLRVSGTIDPVFISHYAGSATYEVAYKDAPVE